MKMAQCIPTPAFKLWHHIPRLFLAQDGSVVAKSGAMISNISAVVSTKSSEVQARNRLHIAKKYGLDVEQQKEIDSLMMRYMFQENTVGSDSEALQCLRKKSCTWGQCEDYETFVRELTELERSRNGAPLKIQAIFAESDSMIGTKGQAYFEKCWHQGSSQGSSVIEFNSRTMAGTDHDSVVQSAEAWESIFQDIQGAEAGNLGLV